MQLSDTGFFGIAPPSSPFISWRTCFPRFRVEALEKFAVRTIYEVEAQTAQAAEQLCCSGKVAYENAAIEEGDEQSLETVSIEPL